MPPPSDMEQTPSGDDEARRALEAVLREEAQRQERVRRPREPERAASGPLLVVGLLLTGVAISIWSSPPAWVRPEPLPPASAARVEAGLRLDMWVALQRIGDFRAERRRLPVTLREAIPEAVDTVGLSYERLSSDAFRLVSAGGGIEIAWDSSEPAEALAGNARAVIGEAAGR